MRGHGPHEGGETQVAMAESLFAQQDEVAEW